jgi:hypothetical protein
MQCHDPSNSLATTSGPRLTMMIPTLLKRPKSRRRLSMSRTTRSQSLTPKSSLQSFFQRSLKATLRKLAMPRRSPPPHRIWKIPGVAIQLHVPLIGRPLLAAGATSPPGTWTSTISRSQLRGQCVH